MINQIKSASIIKKRKKQRANLAAKLLTMPKVEETNILRTTIATASDTCMALPKLGPDKTIKAAKCVFHKMYEGDIKLEIQSAQDYKQLELFRRCLETVENVKVTLNSWSEEKGLMMIVSLRKPVPFGQILDQIPMVTSVYNKKKRNFVAVLEGIGIC